MKRWSTWGILIIFVYLLAIVPTPIANAAKHASTSATAYQINAQHDGEQTDNLTPPLNLKWTTTLAGKAFYPLIAGGKVFVTATTSQGEGLLYAFDLATGQIAWGPIDIGSSGNFAAATYDSGRIFTLNGAGILQAFSAKKGKLLWTTQITSQYSFSSPPTALHGLVYTGAAGSGGTVYAFNENNGSQVWTQSVENGDDSSPAVDSKGVYVSYACNQAYDFSPKSGNLIWHYSGPCEGGGGATTALYQKRLYTRDFEGDLILNVSNGKLTGSYTASQPPAFSGKMGYFLNGSTLSAETLSNHSILWSFTGDGSLVTAPIVDGSYVYIGSSQGNLYALNATTGSQVWSTKVGAAMGQTEFESLAAGGQIVAVPAGNLLSVYG
ncbi:MAG TPA: PQQ-binding-like beta-propeller repeat protein [Ktedonobacteraceae bacterium]|nr:PQQ-binding-like beta-propeller repeat protein [Ktedonobacteraceae bacterium]